MLGLRPISKTNSARTVRAHFPTVHGISLTGVCSHREITPIFYTIPLYKSILEYPHLWEPLPSPRRALRVSAGFRVSGVCFAANASAVIPSAARTPSASRRIPLAGTSIRATSRGARRASGGRPRLRRRRTPVRRSGGRRRGDLHRRQDRRRQGVRRQRDRRRRRLTDAESWRRVSDTSRQLRKLARGVRHSAPTLPAFRGRRGAEPSLVSRHTRRRRPRHSRSLRLSMRPAICKLWAPYSASSVCSVVETLMAGKCGYSTVTPIEPRFLTVAVPQAALPTITPETFTVVAFSLPFTSA